MLFNFIMSLLKRTFLFVCAVIALNSCSTMKHSNLKGGAHKYGWQVDNESQKDYNQDELYYYIAVAEYGELICFEVGDGDPVCFEVEQKIPTILDTEEEPYLFVTIYEPSDLERKNIDTPYKLRDFLQSRN